MADSGDSVGLGSAQTRIESYYSVSNSRLGKEAFDGDKSCDGLKVDAHATARMLFDSLARDPDVKNPGQKNPDQETPIQENPDCKNQNQENPDCKNPGQKNPDCKNPGQKNPDQENPDKENLGGKNPGQEIPCQENPGGEKPGGENPGGENRGEEVGGCGLMANEVMGDCDEVEVEVEVEVEDETEAWIKCNESDTEGGKAVRTSSGGASSWSWSEDVFEKPSMVGAGLENLGNTCFFNAVMQCFTHSVPLVQGLYSYAHPTPCDYSNERFCLICALREHIEYSLTSNGKSVAPWKFVDNLSYFSSSFLRYQQEDAHEFLQCFLDRLESCLTKLKTKDDAAVSQSNNLVKQIFGGRVISKLRCCNCNHISDTYEPSVGLSLEIEDVKSLTTALESFTKVEHIEDEEMQFTCDHCKQKVSVDKQLKLDQIPPICAFHLKRFKNDGSYVEKIDKQVEFPLELDLQPYTSGVQSNDVDFTYELYAVVVHSGFSSSSGHYYCYIRSAPDKWCKFDDRKVTYVSEACVLSEEAYILFYAKQGTPSFSSFFETFKPLYFTNLSNTSPKSVLENVDQPNIPSYVTSATKNHLPQSDYVSPIKEYGSNHRVEVEKTSRITPKSDSKSYVAPIKEYGSYHRVEVAKTTCVTPKSDSKSYVSPIREYGSNHRVEVVKTTRVTPKSDSKSKSVFDFGHALSPSTPKTSPEFYLSDDDDAQVVVIAAKPARSKVVEKATFKRQRNIEVDDSAKREAIKTCSRMQGARANALISAMFPDGGNSVKKIKKTPSSSRKSHSKSSERLF